MRSVVMAYQDIGWVCLDELIALGAEIPLVVTHQDAPGERVWFRSVAERAHQAGIATIAPPSVNVPEVVARIARAAPDFVFSFYFREIVGRDILALPRRGALNLHGSLLPRYRGRCPVNWVLIHGERETGVTLHYMEPKPDCGDIVAQRAVPIADDDTALSLNRKLGEAARALLRATYPLLAAGTAPRIPQDHARATYFGGRRPEDGRIAWHEPARRLYDLIRAVTAPYPGAFTSYRGERLCVWWATPLGPGPRLRARGAAPGIGPGAGVVVAAGSGALLLERVQLAGRDEQRADELAVRTGLVMGERLGGDEAAGERA